MILESDTAFWLLHSWPKYPDIKTGNLASSDFGQTFLCVTLKDVETARHIAEQMYHRQEKRGGGSICFQHSVLWKALSEIEQLR